MKPFWDVEESKGFQQIKAFDGLYYSVYTSNKGDNQEAADLLACIRRDLNTLLIYLHDNPQLWMNHRIAFGIYHAFDIHIPVWNTDKKLSLNYLNTNGDIFNYQEMTPNKYGIIGLNKPKVVVKLKRPGLQDYPIAQKRSIFLTLRNNGKFDKYPKILDLAIHEITHTVCNDVEWKEDNHKKPYPEYNKLMLQWAKECGIL